jgi:hypothetical protein
MEVFVIEKKPIPCPSRRSSTTPSISTKALTNFVYWAFLRFDGNLLAASSQSLTALFIAVIVIVMAIHIFWYRRVSGSSLGESERKETVGHSPYKAQTMFVS